jgi:hypothetical protein
MWRLASRSTVTWLSTTSNINDSTWFNAFWTISGMSEETVGVNDRAVSWVDI